MLTVPHSFEKHSPYFKVSKESPYFKHTLIAQFAIVQDPNSKHLGTTVWDASMVFVKYLIFLLGAVAKLGATLVTYPLLVVKDDEEEGEEEGLSKCIGKELKKLLQCHSHCPTHINVAVFEERMQAVSMAKPIVKVKIIVSKFVETDAMHFKSVVQSLTGKDSVVAEVEADERPREEEIDGYMGGGWLSDVVKGSVVVEIPPSLEDLYDLWAC
ncbi:uncharacterized protein A4U43_C01F25120 [Asparagus officinalis]|uniref:VQ domain-containing protein n=1 Tax=Asparagus officinalis TaxID=4686 RepID=A0A5P1FRZ1_ASPOF|nr:uncharacterized protein A4U43_C01F25120 [Asparagus officinalis]